MTFRLTAMLLILLPALLFSQQKSTDFEISASTMMISVSVGGDFLVTGTFSASRTERVDQLITRLFVQEMALKKDTRIDPKKLRYALRGIILKRRTGETIPVDLARFRVTGDFKHNPQLLNEDVIIFPQLDEDRNFFFIEGAVNNPGRHQFVDGDKLSDAIELAQGISRAYENVEKVRILRLSYSGETVNEIEVGIHDDFLLQRGDRIITVTDETQRKDFRVVVLGEVKNPGLIPITKGTTTVEQAIKLAGGFTEDAATDKIRLYDRNMFPADYFRQTYGYAIDDEDAKVNPYIADFLIRAEAEILTRMSNLTEQDTSYFYLESKLHSVFGAQTIDIQDTARAASVVVRDRDFVIVPAKDRFVTVMGQVRKPGKYPYRDGWLYEDYIRAAGGTGEFAEEDIMVIKAYSREWLSVENPKLKLESGDYIYVPRSPARSFNYYVGQVGTYLGIVGSVATVILLLTQFSK